MKESNTVSAMIIAGAMAMPASAALAAEGLSYGYVEVDYINLDIDQPNENSFFSDDFDNGNGYGINVSLPLSEKFFIYGGYSDTESDFTFFDNSGVFVPGNVNLLKFNLGVGAVVPMSTRSDLVFSGGYADIDYDDFDFGASSNPSVGDLNDDPSDGFTLDAYMRSQLTANIETTIGARYTDIENTDGLSLIGSLMYELNENWGLNLNVDAGDELVTWGAGVRYSF